MSVPPYEQFLALAALRQSELSAKKEGNSESGCPALGEI